MCHGSDSDQSANRVSATRHTRFILCNMNLIYTSMTCFQGARPNLLSRYSARLVVNRQAQLYYLRNR